MSGLIWASTWKTCLRGLRTKKAQTDQLLCYLFLESVIFKLAKSEKFLLVSEAVETSLSLALLEILKSGFLAMRTIFPQNQEIYHTLEKFVKHCPQLHAWYSSISWPSLKLLVIIVFFSYFDHKFSMPKFTKGNNSIKQEGPRALDCSPESLHMKIWCIGMWLNRYHLKIFLFLALVAISDQLW